MRALVGELEGDDSPTIKQIAVREGVGYQVLYCALRREGYQPRRRHTHLTRAQNSSIRRLLMRTNKTSRQIAEQVGCSHYTVNARRKQLRRRSLRGAETELHLREEDRRCPKHGPVKVWPCVACAAIAGRRQRVKRRSSAM